MKLEIINRSTKKIETEEVLCKNAIVFLYKNNFFSKACLFFLAKIPFFSFLYGFFQRTKFSKRKIEPFIKKFQIDSSEFVKNTKEFSSFNDFFIRELKKESRPFDLNEKIAILPSDARYLVFENLGNIKSFFIKEKKFDLQTFLKDDSLTQKYQDGSMVIARLAPSDYHRFHFCISGIALKPRLINGFLYSVNPIALKENLKIFYENKRMLTTITSHHFGDVLYIEIGATNVGSINQTFKIDSFQKKGAEKGYFALGASSVVLLFEKNKIKFAHDLVENSLRGIETKAHFGEILGQNF